MMKKDVEYIYIHSILHQISQQFIYSDFSPFHNYSLIILSTPFFLSVSDSFFCLFYFIAFFFSTTRIILVQNTL
eukprot:UN03445